MSLIDSQNAATQEELAENRAKLREMFGVDEIVFIKRIPYDSNHYYTEYLNSRWMPGGGIFVLSSSGRQEERTRDCVV